MKKILPLLSSFLLFGSQFTFAQKKTEENGSAQEKKPFYIEAGINLSLPVHIEMYRTHRLGIGINARAAKRISNLTEIGLRFEYDYRFIKKNSDQKLTPQSSTLEIASHSNFSLFCLKPNMQFNTKSNWFLGLETGIGYVISDADPKIGFGFVEEYNDPQPLGSCSGIYLGKYFLVGSNDKELGLSLNLTNFVANWHAENTLGLKITYRFIN